jgi:tetratricopeptide (TPR) repeat protein/class 3 adenylate cyclase
MAFPGTTEETRSVDRRVRGTVAVVDMVGYSDIAKLLEENLTAGAVAELNRQIQGFMNHSLSQLPNDHCYRIISRPGDGIIVFFENAEDAHSFGFRVHVFANEHNDQRSELIAERWFRVGIATGEVNMNSLSGTPEYAGITIANACRLESAAGKGEILADSNTFSALTKESKRLYNAEEMVKGKRAERFRARRCRVAVPAESARITSHLTTDRRHFIAASGITLIALTFGGWLERDLIYSKLHPLPKVRHVALLAWPPPSTENIAMLAGILDSIHDRLSRAESYVNQLLIVTADDMSKAKTGVPQATDISQNAQQRASDWGANLILATQVVREGVKYLLDLNVIDAAQMKVLRGHRTQVEFPKNADKLASESAARLLDLPIQEREISDAHELAGVPVAARNLYDEARLLANDPNDARSTEAVEKFQETLNAYPRFALAYSGLAKAYLEQFDQTHDPVTLAIAGDSIDEALRLNPSSESARLAKSRFLAESGHPESALVVSSDVLHTDPQNTTALFLRATALSQLTPPQTQQEEQVYRDIIRNRPNYWYAHNALGVCLHNQGKDDKAEEQFKTASLLMPKATAPLINLGAMYMVQGRDGDAQQVFERSNRIYKNQTAWEYLGDIYYKAKDYTSALSCYLEAEQLNPNDHFILSALGDCYEMLHQPHKTTAYYIRATDELSKEIKIDPTSGNLWMTLALYNAKIGNVEASERDMANAGKHGADDVESLLVKARTLASLGKPQEAKTLVFHCLDKGLASEEVDLAPELAFVSKDPDYATHIKLRAGR